MPAMAGSTTRSPLLSPSPTAAATRRPFRLRPLLALPRSSTSTPRKNHLRPKILKTLTKPFPTAPLPEIAPAPLHPPPPSPPVDAEVLLLPEEEVEGVEELAVSQAVGPAAEYVGSGGKFSAKSVLKFGGYLLGVLLFQAVVSVVVMGVARVVKEEQSNCDGGRRGVGEEVFLMAEEEVERRVREIREMARAVREREKGLGNGRSRVIEEEIGARLNKLEKQMDEEEREVAPAGGVLGELLVDEEVEEGDGIDGLVFEEEIGARNKLGKRLDEEEREARLDGGLLGGLLADEEVEEGDGIESLVFEEKRWFRSTLSGFSSKAKGFSGLSGQNVSDPGVDLMRNEAGALQEVSGTSSPVEVENTLHQSNSKERQYTKGASNSSQHIPTKVDSVDEMKVKDPARRKEASDGRVKQPDVPTDMWWFKLPHVLAILMRRGPQQDEAGLFVLKFDSVAGDEQVAACTLAFEDRSDASNFCNVLESYFENLDNFSADIVSLATKELQESVISQREKVLVVKKGQVKLYTGQPFADVESALRSLL